MTPEKLKASILQYAVQGKLVEQRKEEGSAEILYQQLQEEKQELIKDGKVKKEKPLSKITEDEIPFDIPDTWKWIKLGDIVSVFGGKRIPAGRKLTTENTGYRYIRVSDMKNGNVLTENLLYVPKDIYPSISRYVINKEDVYITVAGTIGRVGKIPPEIDGANLTENADRLVFHTIDQDWLIRTLESALVQQQIVDATTKVGQPKLAIKRIQELLIPLPPIEEQKRIVKKIEEILPIVDRYAVAYEKLEKFNAKFPKDMKNSILQYAIQGKLVEQRAEDGTADVLYQQIQDEKQRLINEGKIKTEKTIQPLKENELPFDIPESWMWCSVGSVCVNIQYGTSSKSSTTGALPVLRMGNIQDGKIVYDKLVYTSDEDEIHKYQLDYNDLLFNRTNSREIVGKTAIYKAEMPAIYAGYLVRLTPVLIDSDYLNYVMQTKYYWSYCQSVRSDAIGQSNINAEKLKRFYFPLPPLAEQKRIVSKIEELLPYCEKLVKEMEDRK